jgi:hypothetical protein
VYPNGTFLARRKCRHRANQGAVHIRLRTHALQMRSALYLLCSTLRATYAAMMPR